MVQGVWPLGLSLCKRPSLQAFRNSLSTLAICLRMGLAQDKTTHLLPPALFLTLLPLSLGATSQRCLPAPSVGRTEEVLMRQSLINPVTLEPFHFCQSHMCANLRSQPNSMKFVKKIESFFHLTPLRAHHSGLCFYILFVCTSVFLFNGGETVTLFLFV